MNTPLIHHEASKTEADSMPAQAPEDGCRGQDNSSRSTGDGCRGQDNSSRSTGDGCRGQDNGSRGDGDRCREENEKRRVGPKTLEALTTATGWQRLAEELQLMQRAVWVSGHLADFEDGGLDTIEMRNTWDLLREAAARAGMVAALLSTEGGQE